MTITCASEDQIRARIGEFHILTYAEVGFAPLSIHGERYELSRDLLKSFADAVNEKGESGSLHPRAPISAVPRQVIRDRVDGAALTLQILDFLGANRRAIRAKRVLCDFCTPRISPNFVAAIEKAMRSPEAFGIDEVVIMVHRD